LLSGQVWTILRQWREAGWVVPRDLGVAYHIQMANNRLSIPKGCPRGRAGLDDTHRAQPDLRGGAGHC